MITSTSTWKTLRLKILVRDKYQCQIKGVDCTGHATQVDKIRTPGDGGDPFDSSNLRAACATCNGHKGRTADRRN